MLGGVGELDAASHIPMLVTSKTNASKEVLARAIHEASRAVTNQDLNKLVAGHRRLWVIAVDCAVALLTLPPS